MYQLMPWGWIIFILRVDRRSSESGRLRMKWKCDRYASPLIISPRPDTDTAPNWLQWGLNGGRGKCFSIFFIFSFCPEATWRLWSVCGLSRIDQEMIVNREPVSISSNSRDILENNWKVYKVHKVVSVQRLQREESNKPLPAAVFEKRELLLIASVKVDRFVYTTDDHFKEVSTTMRSLYDVVDSGWVRVFSAISSCCGLWRHFFNKINIFLHVVCHLVCGWFLLGRLPHYPMSICPINRRRRRWIHKK